MTPRIQKIEEGELNSDGFKWEVTVTFDDINEAIEFMRELTEEQEPVF